MRKNKIILKPRFVSMAFLCITVLGIVVMKTISSQSDSQRDSTVETPPTTLSLAPGFKFININGSRKVGYQVELRNDYDKAIKAFQIGVGRGRMTRDLLYEHTSIAPGASWTEHHGYEPGLEKQSLTIFAVVFEDGTGDGRPQSVRAIKDMRLGARIQMERFEPMLEQALRSPDAKLPDALDALESKVASLPVDKQEANRPYLGFGQHNEKERLLRKIRNIKQSKMEIIPLREDLNNLKQDNRRKAANLTRSAID